MNAECVRCDRSFAPDTRHVELRHQWKPPEDPAQIFHLCPDCADKLGKFLDGALDETSEVGA